MGPPPIAASSRRQIVPRLPLDGSARSAMASSAAGTCKLCGRSHDSVSREYLGLQSLCLHELPPHPDMSDLEKSQGPTLAQFLSAVLNEADAVSFDDKTWSEHGEYPKPGKRISIKMPDASRSRDRDENTDVSIVVKKRVKGTTSSAFLARRSFHCQKEINYLELDGVLAQEHCGQEATYDPSIFDGNELLKWDQADLRGVIADLDPKLRIENVQMSCKYSGHAPSYF